MPKPIEAPSEEPAMIDRETQTNSTTTDLWARFTNGQRRIARLRRIWAFLGQHLQQIKKAGKI